MKYLKYDPHPQGPMSYGETYFLQLHYIDGFIILNILKNEVA